MKRNPRGRSKFDKCVRAVSRSKSARDPRAVCGAIAQRKKRTRKNTAARSNPMGAAEERFERFHGRASDEVVEVTTKIHEHGVLSGLGKLEKLVILTPDGNYRVKLKGFKGAILAMNEQATQLFIEGGDQSVDLRDFGIARNVHEKEVLGKCERVYYFTRKDHLRPEDGGTAIYNHKFGRNKPFVIYDTVNHLLEFAGGGYTLPDEGIDG